MGAFVFTREVLLVLAGDVDLVLVHLGVEGLADIAMAVMMGFESVRDVGALEE